MFGDNSSAKWLWLMALLIAANIGYYFYNNWGLITVKVNDAPLSQVISSIEWQGWVKIYTNLPLDTKVTMFADHVPLAEAMETLAVNVDVPPPPDGDDNARPRRDRPADANGQPAAGAPPAGQLPVATENPPTPAGQPGTSPGGDGAPPGGRGGNGGGGGGFRAAQWNLAFFVAPTESQVKQEIREFQNSDPNDDNKVYTYNTQMQLVSTENTTTAPDPWQQAWPGVKPIDPSAAPAPTNSSTTNAAPMQAGTDQPDPNAPPTVHTYLQDLAASANIWIMAPGSWTPAATAPAANSSIVSAVKNLVSGSHGVVVQALVLRAGRGGASGNRGNFTDDSWADRMQNAINGLPPEERPAALDQLNQEVTFRKSLQTLPPDQRRQKMFAHMMEKMLYGERLSRMSPVKRAQAYKRLVTARAAATAPK